MSTFEARYDHKVTEDKWQKHWYTSDVYHWNSEVARDQSFVIDTPPPTVSGILHMGHIFSYTQTDFIARYQRMIGKNVFYPMGFDDNGLPTERLVEKVHKIKANQLPRDEFKALCYKVINEAEQEFYNLFCSIALSVDWRQKYQTISDQTVRLSQLSFLDLAHKGEVYRTLEPTLWDPTDKTALAQADLEEIETAGTLNDIEFTTTNGQKIIIATTRPELLAACVAVLYHPDDQRYANLAGQMAITPIFGVKVPLIADDKVLLDKGTGLVMSCTFGDTTDIEWWKKHRLPTRVILNEYGRIKLTDKLSHQDFAFAHTPQAIAAIEKLDNQKIIDARNIILEILAEDQKLLKQEQVLRPVKCAERSKTPIEIIVTPQWFIKILDKKELLLKKAAECNWHPQYMQKRIEHWIEGLHWDWCISRQRYFGVPFPVWYSKRKGEEGKVIVATKEELPVDPRNTAPKGYTLDEVDPDTDVMDTWATSSISPQLNSHAINQDYAIDFARHQKLFPADLRPQAHEIIRTWAFYTIAKSLIHQNTLPWRNTLISGWVLATDKSKMSKSKGNTITPEQLIKDSGADVIRYWASTSKLGTDIAYSEQMFAIGKKLITKLWNAAKFAHSHIKDHIPTKEIIHPTDQWLMSKLHLVAKQAAREMDVFEYCSARSIIEEFFWQDFCDSYLELIKVRVYDADNASPEAKQQAINTLHHALSIILRLFAPFLPHITEEIHHLIYQQPSIHRQNSWPTHQQIFYHQAAEDSGDAMVQILDAVRKFKTAQQLSLRHQIIAIKVFAVDPSKNLKFDQGLLDDLKNAANAEKLYINDLSAVSNGTKHELTAENWKFEFYL